MNKFISLRIYNSKRGAGSCSYVWHPWNYARLWCLSLWPEGNKQWTTL